MLEGLPPWGGHGDARGLLSSCGVTLTAWISRVDWAPLSPGGSCGALPGGTTQAGDFLGCRFTGHDGTPLYWKAREPTGGIPFLRPEGGPTSRPAA